MPETTPYEKQEFKMTQCSNDQIAKKQRVDRVLLNDKHVEQTTILIPAQLLRRGLGAKRSRVQMQRSGHLQRLLESAAMRLVHKTREFYIQHIFIPTGRYRQ